mmetsp:Transcript_19335/g.42171  ORF Transcript_19335/g.42171 Transcript_19335/m.42171 type:complete len:835 (+) Transcript_19335:355-2859(+)
MVHLVESETGRFLRSSASGGVHSVYNVDASGKPYLRMSGSQGSHAEPWHSDLQRGQYIRPFTTAPCARSKAEKGGRFRPPKWQESFLLSEGPGPASLLLFEVFDVVEEHRGAGEGGGEALRAERYASVAWAFLDLGSVPIIERDGERPVRPWRLQLYKYCRRRAKRNWWPAGSHLDSGATSPGRERPDVFSEYSGRSAAAASGPTKTFSLGKAPIARAVARAATRLFEPATGPTREPWLATLEVSAELAPPGLHQWSEAESLAQRDLSARSGSDAGEATHHASAGAAASASSCDEGEAAVLATCFERRGRQPCMLPDELLCQISAGKRGASRLSISPSGQLLAVAAAAIGGSSEICVFRLASGSLHTACSSAHGSMVYDLCWHAFSADVSGASQAAPLLISCGGDGAVHIFEVPEDARLVPRGSLQPQARLQLPSHVYSVRPHPALSTEPGEVVLACGGHGFGVILAGLTRSWDPGRGGSWGGRWLPTGQQWQEQVPYEAQLHRAGGPGVEHARQPDSRARRNAPPDVLCVRFSCQPTSPYDLYASDASGCILLFQVRFDATQERGRGAVRATFVRTYSVQELAGVPIYGLDIVTQQLSHSLAELGRAGSGSRRLSAIDEQLLLYSRDGLVRLVCLQRGLLQVELRLSGVQCSSYPVRGAVSPDGRFIACGSETGELLAWDASTGEPLLTVPRVRLAGPVMDVAWGSQHHLLVCCALSDQAPPVLVFVGRHGDLPAPQPTAARGVAYDSTAQRSSPRGLPGMRALLPPVSVAPSASSHDWASQWLGTDGNLNSALTLEEKRQMKEQILARLLDRKGAAELEQHFGAVRALPGVL